MNKNTQIQKYSSLSLVKVQNRITITNKLLASTHVEQLKRYWEDKLDALIKEEKWEELLSESKMCIDILPEWDYCYFNRACAKSELKDYQGAILEYDKYIDLDNRDAALGFSGRGESKYYLKDYKGAIQDYDKCIEIEEVVDKHENSVTYFKRGLAKYGLQDYKGAIDDYDKAIEIIHKSPDLPNFFVNSFFRLTSDYYYNRGSAKDKLGDAKGALEDKKKADELEHKRQREE